MCRHVILLEYFFWCACLRIRVSSYVFQVYIVIASCCLVCCNLVPNGYPLGILSSVLLWMPIGCPLGMHICKFHFCSLMPNGCLMDTQRSPLLYGIHSMPIRHPFGTTCFSQWKDTCVWNHPPSAADHMCSLWFIFFYLIWWCLDQRVLLVFFLYPKKQ